MEIINVNKRLFDLLYETRHTQKELADALGINERNISAWKSRGTNPPSELIAPIAAFFGMSTDRFLTGVDSPSTNVVGGDVTGGTVVQGAGRDVVIETAKNELSDECRALIGLYNTLDMKRRVRLLSFAFSLEDERGGGFATQSVHLSGTCEHWFPYVVELMKKGGCEDISSDKDSMVVKGDYPWGSMSIRLSPEEEGSGVVAYISTSVDIVNKIVDKGDM